MNKIMYAKKINFLLVFFITLISGVAFTACSSDDEDETNSFSFQTDADKALERSLMNTKWILYKKIRYDSNDQIIDKMERDEIYFLSSERLESSELVFARLCVAYGIYRNDETEWRVWADGIVQIDIIHGKLISYTDNELIISTHKQSILGWEPESGVTCYFKRVAEGDESEDSGNVDNESGNEGTSLKYTTWENGVLKNGTKAQPYLGNWLYTYYLNYDGDRWIHNTLYVFNDDGTYEMHDRYVGTSNKYVVSKGTYRISGDKLYYTQENKAEKSKNISDISREMLKISGDRYYPTTLRNLDDNSSIDIRETPAICSHYIDDKVYPHIKITPKLGVSHYTYSLDNGKEVEVSGNYGAEKIYKNLDFGTSHTYEIKAYNKEGKQFPIVKGNFTIPGSQGLVNYFTYNGKVYPIQKVEMQTKHATSSSGANFKYLRMFYSDDTFLQFQYANHSWDGINNTWPSGTYKIETESNEYYKYACLIRIDGRFKEAPEGKLTIKSGSNGSITYDIDLDICRGYFSGQIVK